MQKSKTANFQMICLGFDMDGVVIDHTLNKMRLAEKFGFLITADQTPSEILKKHIPEAVRDQLQIALYHDPKAALRSSAMRGAKPALRELARKQIPFVLISRRKDPETAILILEKHGLWPDFFHERNAFFVSSPEDKNAKAIELGVTHYLDDEQHVLEKLRDVPNRFLFDAHRVLPDAEFYTRIHSWMEFLSHI